MYVYIYIYTHTYVYIYIYIYVNIYALHIRGPRGGAIVAPSSWRENKASFHAMLVFLASWPRYSCVNKKRSKIPIEFVFECECV